MFINTCASVYFSYINMFILGLLAGFKQAEIFLS